MRHVTNILPKIRQHDVVHHRKVGVNKAAGILQNSHVHREGLMEFRLGRVLLSNSLVHHAEDGVVYMTVPSGVVAVPRRNF